MAWTSADTNAEQAARTYTDMRTPEQKALAANAFAIQDTILRMARYTASPKWAQDAKTVWLISDMASELERKLSAVRLDAPALVKGER